MKAIKIMAFAILLVAIEYCLFSLCNWSFNTSTWSDYIICLFGFLALFTLSGSPMIYDVLNT